MLGNASLVAAGCGPADVAKDATAESTSVLRSNEADGLSRCCETRESIVVGHGTLQDASRFTHGGPLLVVDAYRLTPLLGMSPDVEHDIRTRS